MDFKKMINDERDKAIAESKKMAELRKALSQTEMNVLNLNSRIALLEELDGRKNVNNKFLMCKPSTSASVARITLSNRRTEIESSILRPLIKAYISSFL